MGNSGPEELVRGIVEDAWARPRRSSGSSPTAMACVKKAALEQEGPTPRDVAKKEAEAESSRAAEKAAKKD